MQRLLWFLLGSLASVVALVLAVWVLLPVRRGFSTVDPPSLVERWLALAARQFAFPPEANRLVNPIPNTVEAIAEGRAHWADHCASCHANNGSGETLMGRHLYPPAPDMRLAATQRKSDGELFYLIQNGVRLTGMPGWAATAHESDSWKLVRFIRHLPQLSPQEEIEMSELNPKSPDEIREEQEERDFLQGGTIHESTSQRH